jgi:3-oxoacyl-[acyl-carrier-protein] synthase-3
VLFGDGAGAVVLTTGSDDGDISHSYLRSDGSGSGVLYREGGCRLPPEQMASLSWHLAMKGRPVYNFAVRAIVDVVQHFVDTAHIRLDDIAYIVPHQANVRIIQAAAKRLDLPEDRFYLNIHDVANTSAASIPIALNEMVEKDILKRGDLIVTVAFGSGLTYGGNVIRW